MTEVEAASAERLAVLSYGRPAPSRQLAIEVPIPQLGEREMLEVWTSALPLQRGVEGNVSYAANGEVCFGTVAVDPALPLQEATRLAYLQMTRSIRTLGYPSFLRVWNHVPSINQQDAGLERYRQFSIGRHAGFSELGYLLRNDLPAASAVGCTTSALALYFLASRTPAEQLENPRQVSAFDYPAFYGPRSPSFSRAAVKRWADFEQLFLSGTASIVGHESRHHGDVAAQTEETMCNIAQLLERAGDFSMNDLTFVKVYLRNRLDREVVEASLQSWLDPALLLFVEADICRSELLVEIEGVAEKEL